MKRQKRITNGQSPKISKRSKKNDDRDNNDNICRLCESPGADKSCKKCEDFFHLRCVDTASVGSFICCMCLSGKEICFACKEDGELKKCSFDSCNRFYHLKCLKEFRVAAKDKFECPQHFCSTCVNISKRSINKQLSVKCIRCPSAFHLETNCLPSGCQFLSKNIVVCPKHFSPSKDKLFQSVTNIPWCAMCATSGDLIYCETCPGSFHADCLGVAPNVQNFICDDCTSKKFLYSENIVWVKIGSYRWWPSRIINTKDLPVELDKEKPSLGEFPIKYFGTNEYFWTFKSRVYPYFRVDDSASNISQLSLLEARYKTSIDEANCAFEEMSKTNAAINGSSSKPQYKHIKFNKPVGNVQINVPNISSLPQCICDPNSSNPCGYTSECLNRAVLVECHPNVCQAGECCQNQMFQKCEYPKVSVHKTENRGWSLKTLEDIKTGRFVIEYVGDLIDEAECKRRLKEKNKIGDTNYYFLTIDKDKIIDAGPKGNFSRFMNHSCDANCETQKWVVNGEVRIGLFAKRNIIVGEELTFDYMMDSFDNEKLPCFCGAVNCRGGIFVKTQNALPEIKKGKTTRKQKPRANKQGQAEGSNSKKNCFLCSKPNKLIKCDFNGCMKSYHVSCLGRDIIPAGRWHCPWHHCCTCGRLSQYQCSKCTIAFCDRHKTDDNISMISEQLVCFKHVEN